MKTFLERMAKIQSDSFNNTTRGKMLSLKHLLRAVVKKFQREELLPFTFTTVKVNEDGTIRQKFTHTAYQFTERSIPDLNLEMVQIEGGNFLMGSESESEHVQTETPQHAVTVPPFFMGRYPVTQAQWRAVSRLPKVGRDLKEDPSGFKGDLHPVEQVSFYEAEEFCLRLSSATGRLYRLPTEAEWEYACRAGSNTPFHFGETITGDLGNYNSEYLYGKEAPVEPPGMTTPVTRYPANLFGLSDMHGNVWEWCLDHWHKDYEDAPTDGSPRFKKGYSLNIVRGGAWNNNLRNCRSASRSNHAPVNRYFNIGFRVVCSDPKEDNKRHVVRGGAWRSDPWSCRSAYRVNGSPDYRDDFIGFRVVCSDLKEENKRHVVRGGAWYYNPRDCRSASRYDLSPAYRSYNLGFRVVCSDHPRGKSISTVVRGGA